MMEFLLFVAFFIIVIKIIVPGSTKVAQACERNRIKRETETERLRQENYDRYYTEYLSNKRNKGK